VGYDALLNRFSVSLTFSARRNPPWLRQKVGSTRGKSCFSSPWPSSITDEMNIPSGTLSIAGRIWDYPDRR